VHTPRSATSSTHAFPERRLARTEPAPARANCRGWQLARLVERGSLYCATTRLDLADCGPDPALLMAWTVNR
jgi:hypothetical protein